MKMKAIFFTNLNCISVVVGEVSNQQWDARLEQSDNTTFGDDFINNYINPR